MVINAMGMVKKMCHSGCCNGDDICADASECS